jgi:hypothetical protein
LFRPERLRPKEDAANDETEKHNEFSHDVPTRFGEDNVRVGVPPLRLGFS